MDFLSFIKSKVNNLFRNEKGAVLVLVALSMTVLIGFTALVTDVGIMYFNRTDMQKAADAAALAGAQRLPSNPSTATSDAGSYALLNGVTNIDNISVVTEDGNREITVTVNRDVNLLFARILGHNTSQIGVTATARLETVSGLGPGMLIPFGLPAEILDKDADSKYVIDPSISYVLKEGSQSSGHAGKRPGWYLALDPDNISGGGSPDYQQRIMFGYEGSLNLNDVILEESGNKVSATRNGMEYRIQQCQSICGNVCNIESHCPRIVLVPIVEKHPTQNKRHVIIAFAPFYLEGIKTSGGQGQSEVFGRFVPSFVISGEAGPSDIDTGLYTARLAR